MGDFVQWGCAIASHPSLKPLWRAGKSGQQTFLAQFDANRVTGTEIVLDASPIAHLLNQLLEENGGRLEATPTDLLKMLEGVGNQRLPDFPKTPHGHQAPA